VRVYLPNSKNIYQIGQLVKAIVKTESKKSLWIPTTATNDLGIQKIVFVKRSGTFRPKSISTGHTSDNWIEITSGVEAQDSIAYDAQFVMDSDGFIKVKN
jgi:Cu(I)/Ag(I) efflux system membrane fusion protein